LFVRAKAGQTDSWTFISLAIVATLIPMFGLFLFGFTVNVDYNIVDENPRVIQLDTGAICIVQDSKSWIVTDILSINKIKSNKVVIVENLNSYGLRTSYDWKIKIIKGEQ